MTDEPPADGGGSDRRRELFLLLAALALIAWPFFVFEPDRDDCRTWHWLIPLSQLLGGAAVFGYADRIPVRGLGCLAMVAAAPVAAVIFLCGVTL